MSENNFIIRSFSEVDGQVVVEFNNNLGVPSKVSVDLVIDDNGNVPEGDALYAAINQFYPTWYFERLAKLAAGIKNAAAVRASVVPYPAPSMDELASQAIIKRNDLLFNCDWTQLPDVPLTEEKKLLWAEYRQNLRDITKQPEFPTNIIWPTVELT